MLRRSPLRLLTRSAAYLKEEGTGTAPQPFSDWLQSRGFRDVRGYQHFRRRSAFNAQGRLLPGIAVATVGSLVVWTTCREEIPYTHRKHLILVSQDQEKRLGQQVFKQVKEEAVQQRKLLPASHPYTRLVQRVGKRISQQATDGFRGTGVHSHMQGLEWEFLVVDEDQENAFVVPGGKVVVYSGLLKMLDDEEELATVLSHEVAHVLARHVAEKVTQSMTWLAFFIILEWTLGLPLPIDIISGLVMSQNSRKLETEADRIGLTLAAQACYNPSAFVPVMTKLGEAEAKAGFKTPEFLRTHPVSTTRIRQIKADLPAAEEKPAHLMPGRPNLPTWARQT
ncbi:hypothetical protein WJX73_006218 [Symbiochloris irregularis]|uniref:Peptidase M48 domain-containing protein n=1 Tax=Symbiochloris irregularis TaxID=706552 RepID=A0AAW1PDW1_9CHLO